MSNAAVITTKGYDRNTTGIYLHWNGGRDSVEAFLAYAKIQGFRDPLDDSYGMARLTQVIANFLTTESDRTSSVGIGPLKELNCDNYDNGLYVIDGEWNIIDREYFYDDEQKNHSVSKLLVEIDKQMPSAMQVGEEAIKAWLKHHRV